MKRLRSALDGSATVICGVVALLVSIIIGVLVWYKIDASLVSSTWSTLPVGAKAAWNSTNASANTSLTLMPIVAIVLIAGIILAIVVNFGQQRA